MGLHDLFLKEGPVLLRSLRERDARRNFCHSELWGIPYANWVAEGGQRRWEHYMSNLNGKEVMSLQVFLYQAVVAKTQSVLDASLHGSVLICAVV